MNFQHFRFRSDGLWTIVTISLCFAYLVNCNDRHISNGLGPNRLQSNQTQAGHQHRHFHQSNQREHSPSSLPPTQKSQFDGLLSVQYSGDHQRGHQSNVKSSQIKQQNKSKSSDTIRSAVKASRSSLPPSPSSNSIDSGHNVPGNRKRQNRHHRHAKSHEDSVKPKKKPNIIFFLTDDQDIELGMFVEISLNFLILFCLFSHQDQ